MIVYSFDKNTIVFSIQFLILIYKIEISCMIIILFDDIDYFSGWLFY